MLLKPRWDEFWQVWKETTGRSGPHRQAIETTWLKRKAKLIDLLGKVAVTHDVLNIDLRDELPDKVRAWVSATSAPMLAREWLRHGVNPDELTSGRILEPKRDCYIYQDLARPVQVGQKLGAVYRVLLGQHLPELPKEDVDLLINQLGQLLESLRKTEDSTLVLSVDPLDFLLASEHTTGWTSCYCLSSCHCAGTLAYLMDETTILAYGYRRQAAYHETKLVLPVKAWRQWIHVDIDRLVAAFQREYPGTREAYASVARQAVGAALTLASGNSEWFLDRRYDAVESDSNLVFIDQTIVYVRPYSDLSSRRIEVGAPVPCPNCDSEELDSSGRLICSDCAGCKCQNCGRFVNEEEEELIETPDGSLYCDECWDGNCTRCDECRGVLWQYNAVTGPDQDTYCEDCFHKLFASCSECGELIEREDLSEGSDGQLYCESCFGELFTYCYSCDKTIAQEDACQASDGELYCQDCLPTQEEEQEEKQEVAAQ